MAEWYNKEKSELITRAQPRLDDERVHTRCRVVFQAQLQVAIVALVLDVAADERLVSGLPLAPLLNRLLCLRRNVTTHFVVQQPLKINHVVDHAPYLVANVASVLHVVREAR